MRRSAAPSQRSGGFVPPARAHVENVGVVSAAVLAAPAGKPTPTPTPPRATAFKTPLRSVNAAERAAEPEPAAEAGTARYFSCMWCKRSSKKHKRWEGDAVLVVRGRSATLQDQDGKDIGHTIDYPAAQLASLRDGETLTFSGKEIEVGAPISQGDYESGKCFAGVHAARAGGGEPSRPAKAPRGDGPAVAPAAPETGGAAPQLSRLPGAAAQPLYDPTSRAAIVLPRPPPGHSRVYNPRGHAVVDVVIDPFLVAHLRPHQVDGVKFLYECTMGFRDYGGCGALLADEMGLGKTLQCITLLWTLLKQNPYACGAPVVRRALIVCPSSLVKNWTAELKKWLGNERLRAYAVGTGKPLAEFHSSIVYPVLVVSYDALRQEIDQIARTPFGLVICDEGHRLKNENAKTTRALASLNTRRRVILTGTPVQNDLQEFYAIIQFCNPGVVGSTAAFKRLYETPIVRGRAPDSSADEKRLGASRARQLQELTSQFVLRRTADLLRNYLPPKTEVVLFCPLTPLQLALYNHALASKAVRSCLLGHGAAAPNTAAEHLACIAGLRKVTNHPALVYEQAMDPDDTLFGQIDDVFPSSYGACQTTAAPACAADGEGGSEADPLLAAAGIDECNKLGTVAHILAAVRDGTPDDRVVVVSNFTKTLDLVGALCRRLGYGFLRLDGSTPTARRHELVTRFNQKLGSELVFLLSSKAGGVGLNLTGASRLILYDTDWNPANDLQAMARVWRDGQRRRVFVYRLIGAGTIEEKIYQRQLAKQGLSGAMMDTATPSTHDLRSQFTLEELRDLFTLRENVACETHDLIGCDCLQRATACTPDKADGDGEDDDPLSVTFPGDDDADDADRAPAGERPERALPANERLMHHLMSWQHYGAPLASASFPDSVAAGLPPSVVSFAFLRETLPTADALGDSGDGVDDQDQEQAS